MAWLERAGCTVDVVSAGRGPGRVSTGARLFEGAGAPELLARSPRAWLWAAGFSAALTAEVRRRAKQWDAAVAHWLVPCGVAAALTGVPTTAIAHSGDVHLLRRLRLTPVVARIFARAKTHVVFVSESLRSEFLANAGNVSLSTSVSPMGIDIERFASLRAEAPAETDATDATDPTVLFLGRLVPVKGADILLAAMPHMKRSAYLVVAGDGPELPNLRVIAPRAVRFVGEVHGAERDRLFARADVLAIPSVAVEGGRSEGTPVVALEAMAAGIPVVASRIGGLADLPERIIELVEPRDPVAMAGAIDRALETGAERARAAREWVREYDWERIGPNLLPPGNFPEMNNLRLRRTA